MLYVTTRDAETVYTAQTTMDSVTAPDGGLFVPMQLPFFDARTICRFVQMPFWDCVCEILNQFFPLSLRGSILSDTCGPVMELHQIKYKITVAELWNQRIGCCGEIVENLLLHMGCKARQPEAWPVVAIHTAVLFGLYGVLCRNGSLTPGEKMPLAVACGELELVNAVGYASQMGLPAGNVVCVCGENSMLWELLHKGETRLEWGRAAGEGATQGAIPQNLERLIACRLGTSAVETYQGILRRRGVYALRAGERTALKAGISVSVVSLSRTETTIRQVYKNARYLLSPHTAAIYSGLMDFRALEAEGSPVVLLAEESPMRWGKAVLRALKLPVRSVTEQIEALQRETSERQGED